MNTYKSAAPVRNVVRNLFRTKLTFKLANNSETSNIKFVRNKFRTTPGYTGLHRATPDYTELGRTRPNYAVFFFQFHEENIIARIPESGNFVSMTNKTHYQGKLPHYHPRGADFFVTYRLVGSIPKLILKNFNEKYMNVIKNPNAYYTGKDYDMAKHLFFESDNYLDNNVNGPYWLQDDAIASIVANSLHRGHNRDYLLHCFSIMSNHVHVLLKHIDSAPLLSKILQMHKGTTAFECNKILNRNGQFWDRESYDRVTRNAAEFEKVKNYILNNPVKAGFVQDWRDWKWNYLAG